MGARKLNFAHPPIPLKWGISSPEFLCVWTKIFHQEEHFKTGENLEI